MTLIIRFFDILLSLTGLIFGSPLLLLLYCLGYLDTGSPLFRQVRVGQGGVLFTLVKFRTMKAGTISVATHLAEKTAITPWGHFLRRTKLDELPQLWNVFKGDMSLVGPRPCLPEQEELIAWRRKLGVLDMRPGITGLAQVTGIDMSNPQLLAETDILMAGKLSLSRYFYFVALTVIGKGSGDRINTQ